MLKNFVKDTYQRLLKDGNQKKKLLLIDEINLAEKSRKTQRVIELLRQALKLDPKDVKVMAALGLKLGDVGEIDEAYALFELAHRLDDSNLHVAVNYASYLIDRLRKSDEAIAILSKAQLLIPNYPHINTLYAAIQLTIGNAYEAKEYRLRGWLADFDNARLADGYLWFTAYADVASEILAAEHHFWAQTCQPLTYQSATVQSIDQKANRPRRGKLRIGYWSPDFKNHSVRYFFRPLLEGHDRSRVELYLYHDSKSDDAQTEEIKIHCDQFHFVHEKTDDELAGLIVSHDLDVLVELAGHTSNNRLWMMQARLAHIQVTALGYPATTGLDSIDFKLVDRHLFSPGDEKYYSERPLIMPESYWCFDPREDAPLPQEPPVKANGYITFACVGNVGKITPKILTLWVEILRRVPRSRLILRSVNFLDPLSLETMRITVRNAGIDDKRVVLLGPAVGDDFFRSYDEIDIVLDTFPFNGGTTSCFAVYMGVPVVTMAGDSLISRMGASVMTNAGGEKWIANNESEYISKAINLSQDIGELQDFRKNARGRVQKTSLGNGQKFAMEFEDACLTLVKTSGDSRPARQIKMPLLKPEEIIRRAATVLNSGQPVSAGRIIKYCLNHYPNFAGAHILKTDALTDAGDFTQAAEYLLERLEQFDEEGKTAALINIVRFMIILQDQKGVENNLRRLQNSTLMDDFEKAQAKLYEAFSDWHSRKVPQVPFAIRWKKIHFIIPCDDTALFDLTVNGLKNCFKSGPGEGGVFFERCAEALRVEAYERALQAPDADIVIFLQKNISVWNPHFLHEVSQALRDHDVVGYSGARQWDRLDWRLDALEKRHSGFINESAEKAGHYQVLVAGLGREKVTGKMVVLEGDLIAIKAAKASKILFDAELMDSNALMEEWWTHAAAKAGLRLAAHRSLGVQVRGDVSLRQTYLAASRMLFVERLKFEIFSIARNDGSFLVCPCFKPADGAEILEHYFSDAHLD